MDPHESGDEWRRRAPWLRQEIARLLDADIEPAQPHGRPAEKERGTFFSVGRSDTREKVTARLKRDDPEIAERVARGEITANAAAREMGWRKPRILLTSPAAVAVRIRQHFTPDQVVELRSLLGEDP